jgi:hypothetical protein
MTDLADSRHASPWLGMGKHSNDGTSAGDSRIHDKMMQLTAGMHKS